MSQNAIAARASERPVCNGSGNCPEARRCLICERPAQGRSMYCSDAHRAAAFRLRGRQELAPRADGLRAELRRRGQLAAHTVYECEDCGERFLGQQRCELFRCPNKEHYADLVFMPRWRARLVLGRRRNAA